MNREGGETFLRLLAEAEMRDQLAPSPPPWAGRPGTGRVKVMLVGQALTAVRALDTDTVENILADFDLAVSVRRLHDKAGQGPAGTGLPGARPGTMRAASAARLAAQMGRSRPPARLALSRPPGSTGSPGPADPKDPPPPDHDPGQGPADRFVPLGLTVPLHHDGISGDLYLMSFAHTGSGARFIAVWGLYTPTRQLRLGLRHPDLIPFELFTVADDRGARYDLDFTPGDGPEWTSEISLRPTPPDDVRWLDVAAPLSPAVRIDLGQGGSPANGEPDVSEAKLSRGEHLLIMLAEWLLTVAPEFSHDLRRGLAAPSPGMLQAMTAALGDIIAGLEAADVLSPLSPVPARLAALCASLRIGGHGIAAPPTDDLPERWLSLLAHYQRRKPDTASVRDGYAAVAAALPELDGIRLALLGLHNTEGMSYLHVLAQGMTAEQAGPLGVDLDFPLSVWLRDSGGRWHAARPAGWHGAGPRSREYAVRLRLVPPLPQSTTWVEVLAGGRSAEVRTTLPLRWGFPS
ncbi:MAG: hypothetical protein ACLPKE_19675 [Streptosporangiaceae bacterium]